MTQHYNHSVQVAFRKKMIESEGQICCCPSLSPVLTLSGSIRAGEGSLTLYSHQNFALMWTEPGTPGSSYSPPAMKTLHGCGVR